MDLGIVLSTVISNINTTLTGFSDLIMLTVGVAIALWVVKKFVRVR